MPTLSTMPSSPPRPSIASSIIRSTSSSRAMLASIENALASLAFNALDGVIGAGAVQIGDRDMGPFPCKQQRHRPAVSDRIGGGVERPLSRRRPPESCGPEAARGPAPRLRIPG
jgi:hypothetical protein